MSPAPLPDSRVETPTFHEDWYSDQQRTLLVRLCRYARDLPGAVMEIGCWEGKSTIALANTCHPEVLLAVDSWLGNLTEPDHPTVEILTRRDVFQTFIDNVGRLTFGNVEVHRADCFDFLSTFDQPVKFCHVDAAHDFASVRRTLEHLKPLVVPGGVLCGDDHASAHKDRADLDGGVERACKETFPAYISMENFWLTNPFGR